MDRCVCCLSVGGSAPPRRCCALAACGGTKNEAYIEKPVDDLYNKAMDALVEERYATAAKTFERGRKPAPVFGLGDQGPADGGLCPL